MITLFLVFLVAAVLSGLAVRYHYVSVARVQQIERDLVNSIESESRYIHERLTALEEAAQATTLAKFGLKK